MAKQASGKNQTSQTDQQSGSANALPVGEILRRTRSHYGKSYDDVERALRIRAEQIEAIESNNMDALPARVYVLGFVRSYSEYLGLDGAKMVELFKSQSVPAQNPNLNFPTVSKDNQMPSIWLVVASVILLCAAIFGVVHFKGSQKVASNEVPTVPEDIMASSMPQSSTVITPEEAQADSQYTSEEQNTADESITPSEGTNNQDASQNAAAARLPDSSGIHLMMQGDATIEIYDVLGKVLLTRTLSTGDAYALPTRSDLMMRLNNGEAAKITVNGVLLDRLSDKTGMIEGIPLNPELLLQQYVSPQSDNTIEN